MKEYKILDGIQEENIDQLREFAEAMTELISLKRRMDYLEDLVEEHCELRPLIWTTQEGISKPISDLDDGHLKNIIPYLSHRGANNNRIAKEYQKRFGEMPALPEAKIIREADLF